MAITISPLRKYDTSGATAIQEAFADDRYNLWVSVYGSFVALYNSVISLATVSRQDRFVVRPPGVGIFKTRFEGVDYNMIEEDPMGKKSNKFRFKQYLVIIRQSPQEENLFMFAKDGVLLRPLRL